MKLCDKIRIIRKARGFSQEGLGDSLSRVSKDGISRQSISDWENGKSEPKLDNIRDLASVLNVSFDALLDESIDLDDQAVLTSVLSHTNSQKLIGLTPVGEDVIENRYNYSIYKSTVTVKTFRKVIACGCTLILTILTLLLMIFCNLSWMGIIAGVCAFTTVTILFPLALVDLIQVAKGRMRTVVGTLSNSNLILYAYKDISNTLHIPVGQIVKMELGKSQKKNSGELLIYVTGKSRPITATILHPQKLIDVWTKISNDNEDNEI